MCWKSTEYLTRKEVIELILARLEKPNYDNYTNDELINILDAMDYGDNMNLPYYGHNFIIKD